MSKIWKWAGVVAGIVAICIAVLGTVYDWSASRYTIALTFSALIAFFFGTAGLGGTGPGMGIGAGPMSGDVVDAIATGEETRQAYKPSGRAGGVVDVVRARRGWNPGNYSFARVMLGAAAILAIAAIISWKFFE
jgi:hypothetical protein